MRFAIILVWSCVVAALSVVIVLKAIPPMVAVNYTETPPGSGALPASDDRELMPGAYVGARGLRPGVEIVPGLNYDLWSGTVEFGVPGL